MPPVVTVHTSPYKTTHECMGGKYMCSHTDVCLHVGCLCCLNLRSQLGHGEALATFNTLLYSTCTGTDVNVHVTDVAKSGGAP